jgi:1,5-anhydro-D-fructose reductase (1,5-anhydro-D-mannitol-forming)
MSGRELGWGLVGASSWAAEWMIDAIEGVEGSHVLAVYSASLQRGERFAADNGVPRAHVTLEDLVGDPDIGAVYVSTTNDLHAEQVIAAAAMGKHVLCEKPLATNLEDAARMRDACLEHGVVMAVNHHNRNKATFGVMRELIAAGAIGDVLAARISNVGSLVEHRRTWRVTRPETGAGVVLDLTVHDADTLRFVLDDEIVAVTAMATSQTLGEAGIEDGVVGTMRTARGTLVSFHDAFTIGHAGTGLEVYGTSGSLLARDVLGALPSGDVFLRRGESVEPVPIPDRDNPYRTGVQAFVDAVLDGRRPAATAEDGIASLAVALAVLASAADERSTLVARLT